jgi:hypothetical protein
MSYRSIFCIAPSRELAARILRELKDATVSGPDISVLLLSSAPGTDGAAVPDPAPLTDATLGKAAKAAAAMLKSLPGIDALVVPGCPPLLAAGPMGAAVGGASRRGLAAGLVDFGLPELEASQYEAKIRSGSVLISLRAENPDQSDRARVIFRAAAAEDIRTIMVVPHRGSDAGRYTDGVSPSGYFAQRYGRSGGRSSARKAVAL